MRRSASSSNSKRRWRGSGGGSGGEGEESPLLRGDVVSLEPPPLGLRDRGGGRSGGARLGRGRADRASGRGVRGGGRCTAQPLSSQARLRAASEAWPAARGPRPVAPYDRRVSFLLSFTVHSTLSFRALAVAWASWSLTAASGATADSW